MNPKDERPTFEQMAVLDDLIIKGFVTQHTLDAFFKGILKKERSYDVTYDPNQPFIEMIDGLPYEEDNQRYFESFCQMNNQHDGSNVVKKTCYPVNLGCSMLRHIALVSSETYKMKPGSIFDLIALRRKFPDLFWGEIVVVFGSFLQVQGVGGISPLMFNGRLTVKAVEHYRHPLSRNALFLGVEE